MTDLITMISFSGGRTSGMMAKILCDNLPEDERIICFANTGKEHEKTLEFVRDWEKYFKEKIYWLEYCPENRFREVTFETASRKGEPFAALIEKRNFCPNPVSRFCTTELKIRPIKHFMLSLGFEHWENAVGIRYDEPRRYAKIVKASIKDRWDNVAPLFDMRVTKPDVLKWWKAQPFDLNLDEHLGNCDMCFLKSRSKLKHIIKTEPYRADWWIAQEVHTKGTFRNGLSIAQLVHLVETAPGLFDDEIEIDCFCNVN